MNRSKTPDGYARRWGKRRAIKFAARIGTDPRCAGFHLHRIGLLRWQIIYWLDLDPR